MHVSILAAYNLQLNFFVNHLKDFCNLIGGFLNLDIQYDFSKKSFVFKYLPELIARFLKITNEVEESITNEKHDDIFSKLKNEAGKLERV